MGRSLDMTGFFNGGGRGIRIHVPAQHRQNDFESYEKLAFSCLRGSYEAVMEEEKILATQAFADVLTSSIQNVLQGDQGSNKPAFLQEWPFFLHVCKKIGKKKRLRLHHTEYPFGPEYEKELLYEIRCKRI